MLAVIVIWAGMAAPAMAQIPASAHLATLDIALWPEYDKLAVLVIYRGSVAQDVPLPANIFILLPSDTLNGQPNTVVGQDVTGRVINIPHTVSQQLDGLLVSFSTAYRVFQLEFYAPLDVAQPQRSYRLMWAGNMVVDRATLQVQEPFGARSFWVTPSVEAGQRRDDGLIYHAADLGSLHIGPPFTIELGYTRAYTRTSVQVLGLNVPTPSPPAGVQPPALDVPPWIVGGGAAGIILIVAGILWYMFSRASPPAQPHSRSQRRGQPQSMARKRKRP